MAAPNKPTPKSSAAKKAAPAAKKTPAKAATKKATPAKGAAKSAAAKKAAQAKGPTATNKGTTAKRGTPAAKAPMQQAKVSQKPSNVPGTRSAPVPPEARNNFGIMNAQTSPQPGAGMATGGTY